MSLLLQFPLKSFNDFYQQIRRTLNYWKITNFNFSRSLKYAQSHWKSLNCREGSTVQFRDTKRSHRGFLMHSWWVCQTSVRHRSSLPRSVNVRWYAIIVTGLPWICEIYLCKKFNHRDRRIDRARFCIEMSQVIIMRDDVVILKGNILL